MTALDNASKATAGRTRTVSVIADDLTGSTDTVVQFRQAGWPAYLLLAGDAPQEVTEQAGPVATSRSLDTRALPEQEAAQVTARAVREQTEAGTDRLYVKIDSTMRGSIAGQISGALDAWSRQHREAVAVICPAYPQMGRVITGGQMLVNGVPLPDSPAGSDPVTPVTTSVLTDLVPGAVNVASGGTPADLAAQILQAGPGGRVIVDAVEEEDLARLAGAVDLLGTGAVSVGSAGLARHLARIWLPQGTARLPARNTQVRQGRIVVVMSSLNEVSREQADHLAGALDDQLTRHELDPARLADAEQMQRWGRDLPAHHPAQVILLQPTSQTQSGGDPAAAARLVSGGLAAAVVGLIDSGQVAGLVLIGGDGAEATLARLRTSALRVEGAATEGVPLSRLVGGRAAELVVATKAGGFGTRATLTDVISAMLETKEA